MGTWAGHRPFDEVLDAARQGDEAAFAVLWRWLQPPLVRWLGVVAPGHVDDVASEVWLSVARALSRFEGGEAEFRGWIFTIARRRAIDAARQRRRRPPTTALGAMNAPDPTADVSAPLSESTALDSAMALLRHLTPEQAEVVALRVIVGLTVAETAAVVGRTDGAVRVLCHRGLRTLAGRLATDELAGGVTR